MMMSRRITLTLQILPMAVVVNVEAEKNQYYLHEISVEAKKDTLPFKTGTVNDGTPSDNVSSIYTLLEKLQNVNKQFSKNTFIDSEGNELTNEQQEYFKDSKVRDEDGNLLVVYHGSYEDFTVFDKTKGRANMDIQGSFFSPQEIDAGGYGPNVKAYYLNITNPADEQTGYKALRKYQGQNGAGYTENDGNVDLREEDNRKSRNTRLNYDENFDDVNDAFEQAIKVLQNINGIDVSSELVEEVGNGRLLALLKKGNLIKP